jgi:hypothetical protein
MSRTHPNTVLRHTIQTRHARRHQRRETVDEKLLQRSPMPNPKIRQRLGVHANPATQPLICDMLLAQPHNELEGRIGQPLEKHNLFQLAMPVIGDENQQPISGFGRQRQPPSEPSVF